MQTLWVTDHVSRISDALHSFGAQSLFARLLLCIKTLCSHRVNVPRFTLYCFFSLICCYFFQSLLISELPKCLIQKPSELLHSQWTWRINWIKCVVAVLFSSWFHSFFVTTAYRFFFVFIAQCLNGDASWQLDGDVKKKWPRSIALNRFVGIAWTRFCVPRAVAHCGLVLRRLKEDVLFMEN